MISTWKPLNYGNFINEDNPHKEGTYLCRTNTGYIKTCYWNGTEWKDMWKDTLDAQQGEVIRWMNIPEGI